MPSEAAPKPSGDATNRRVYQYSLTGAAHGGMDRYWQEDYWFGPPNPITGHTDPCSTFREQFWTSSSQMQGGFWTNECGQVQGYELSWRECME